MSVPAPDRDRLLADLAAMIRTPSVNSFGAAGGTPPEAAMAELFARQLAGLGLEVDSHEVSAGRRNVWGRLRGSGGGPTVLLAGHLDTVGVAGYDAPFEPRIADGKIYGRGSCDMKAGLAAYLETIRLLQQAGTPLAGDVIVAGVVDEEHGMLGSRHFGRHGPPVDCAIVAEPSGLAVCPAHKGQICFSITTRGVSAHSSTPALGVNAIWHMTHVLSGLHALAADLQQRTPDPVCGTPSLSVGVIAGGANASSVPDICRIDVDRRTIPGETLATVRAEIDAVLATVAAQHPDFNATVSPPDIEVPPFSTPHSAPIVASLLHACHAVTGAPPVVAAFTGSTDAPNFDCPAVICGAGALAQCHSLNEFIDIEELVDAVQIYVRTLQHLQP